MNRKKKCYFLWSLVILAAVFLCRTAFSQKSEQANLLYHRGLHLEEVKGELEEAIKVYREVIEKYPEEREAVARALLRLGLCYEKLGREGAQNVYLRIVKEFSDQSEVVIQAQTRLSALQELINIAKEKGLLIPEERPSLAVLHFENASGDENLDDWTNGLPELLITDLAQSRFIDVLDSRTTYLLLKELNLLEAKKYSRDDLVKIAKQAKVDHLLYGIFSKTGENIIITLVLQKSETGKIIDSMRVECKNDREMASHVDDLTRQIKKDLNLTPDQIENDIDKEIEKITTSSPAAFQYFIEGNRLLYGGDPRGAIPYFERAIAEDPEFAYGYRALGVAHRNSGDRARGREFIEKAFEILEKHPDRVSEREKFHIQATLFFEDSTCTKAIDAYENLLQVYPSDMISRANLVVIYLYLEEPEKAKNHAEYLIQTKVVIPDSWINASAAFTIAGDSEKARQVLETGLSFYPGDARLHATLATHHLRQKEFDLAQKEIDASLIMNPTIDSSIDRKGYIHVCKLEFNRAEKEYNTLRESKSEVARVRGYTSLAHLALLRGQFGRARELIDQGIELHIPIQTWISVEAIASLMQAYVHIQSGNYEKSLEASQKAEEIAPGGFIFLLERQALYFKGLSYLGLGEIKETQRAANRIKEISEASLAKRQIRYYYLLMGQIQEKSGDHLRAIESFEKAVSLLLPQQWVWYSDHALFLVPLGRAYYEAGDMDKALETYENVTALTSGRIEYGDIYAKSFDMLGKIYEQKGQKDKAIENTEKFLFLWKDADDGLPEVDDARTRLTRLKSQSLCQMAGFF